MMTRCSARIAKHQEDTPALDAPVTPKLSGQKRNAAGSVKPMQLPQDEEQVARTLETLSTSKKIPGKFLPLSC
jgi:hypothetical protein